MIAGLLLASGLFGDGKPSLAAPDALKQKREAVRSKPIRRADFTIGGASCLTCLRRIERVLRQSPGVIKVEVDVHGPYRAAVFYDAQKTNPDSFWKPLAADRYVMNDLRVEAISEVPAGTLFNPGKSSREKEMATPIAPPPVEAP